jgi:hypothetical protein
MIFQDNLSLNGLLLLKLGLLLRGELGWYCRLFCATTAADAAGILTFFD